VPGEGRCGGMKTKKGKEEGRGARGGGREGVRLEAAARLQRLRAQVASVGGTSQHPHVFHASSSSGEVLQWALAGPSRACVLVHSMRSASWSVGSRVPRLHAINTLTNRSHNDAGGAWMVMTRAAVIGHKILLSHRGGPTSAACAPILQHTAGALEATKGHCLSQ